MDPVLKTSLGASKVLAEVCPATVRFPDGNCWHQLLGEYCCLSVASACNAAGSDLSCCNSSKQHYSGPADPAPSSEKTAPDCSRSISPVLPQVAAQHLQAVSQLQYSVAAPGSFLPPNGPLAQSLTSACSPAGRTPALAQSQGPPLESWAGSTECTNAYLPPARSRRTDP